MIEKVFFFVNNSRIAWWYGYFYVSLRLIFIGPDMKISKFVTAAFLAVIVSNVSAHKSLVGIVSVQDSVKSVQVGVISSVATDGGHGLQLSGVSNASAQTFNGLQLSGVSNITNGMDRGLQLSGLLNVSEAIRCYGDHQYIK